jgi:DNA (cytosine-5)-methyltransferase 1
MIGTAPSSTLEFPSTPAVMPSIVAPKPQLKAKPDFLEFFADSGMVSPALAPYFSLSWANYICPKKAAIFHIKQGDKKFHLASIEAVDGAGLPEANLSWACIQCQDNQDLPLAGKSGGIQADRSGFVCEWLRVMDEMPQRPPVLAAENVLGLMCLG